MGTLQRFGKIVVALFALDHEPPHVHVQGPDWDLAVRLDNLEVLGEAAARREAREALDWIGQNRALLLARWKELHG